MKKAADRKFSEQTYMTDFFESFGLKIENMDTTPAEYIKNVPEEKLEDLGIDPETFFASLEAFAADFESMMNDKGMNVDSLTIVGGQDKSGNLENVQLTIHKGDIICIVGLPVRAKAAFSLILNGWRTETHPPGGVF
ncbi:MAG: hypothetical protein LRY51_18915 [Geovibrio sp.]|nr:hypothetical protein [Geovibrio sp.]